ncbi:hypothetical protein ACFLXC_02590 [Chloroflexota bacterium]
MVIQSLVFALMTWGITLVVAVAVAGIIMLIYKLVHKKEVPATGEK